MSTGQFVAAVLLLKNSNVVPLFIDSAPNGAGCAAHYSHVAGFPAETAAVQALHQEGIVVLHQLPHKLAGHYVSVRVKTCADNIFTSDRRHQGLH